MNMSCLLFLGLISCIQTFFDCIILLTSVGGRTKRSVSQTKKSGHVREYTTSIVTYSFFDSSEGFRYNLESALMIALPTLMLINTILAYYSFMAFPSPLFTDDEDIEPGPMRGGRYGGYAGGGGYGSGGGYGAAGGRSLGRAQPRDQGLRLFEGA